MSLRFLSGSSGSASATSPYDIAAVYGWKGVTCDPGIVSGTYTVGTQALNGGLLTVNADATLANFHLYVSGAGVTLSGAYACVWNVGGTLLGKTADQATGWTSTGFKSMALTAESGQSLAVTAGQRLIVGVTIASAGTSVTMLRSNINAAAAVNLGLSSPAMRTFFKAGVASPPASLASVTADNNVLFFAVS